MGTSPSHPQPWPRTLCPTSVGSPGPTVHQGCQALLGATQGPALDQLRGFVHLFPRALLGAQHIVIRLECLLKA